MSAYAILIRERMHDESEMARYAEAAKAARAHRFQAADYRVILVDGV